MPTKKRFIDPGQLTIFGLLEELDKQPGRPVEWPVLPEDIGGELLAVLSKGLYPNPLDCIREYVQNAVDAQAKTVTIKITGNSVLIFDDGSGMSLEELVQARQFGISPKSLTEHVGFRGIGIYSGFDLCNRLLITTKKTGETKAHILEFDFGSMKTLQERERQESQNPRTSLTQLLTTYSHFMQEPDDPDRHYTMVQLEDISDTHIDQLADREKLRKYILLNLPIDFDDDFPYKEAIYEHIRKYIKNYNAVKIILETDSAPREIVCRPNIPNLRKPDLDVIYNAKNERIACYWACLHVGGGRVPEEYADYRGFVYRIKGFTIGDNRRLHDRFKKGSATLYWWYVGEIFVLDHNVIPNAARDDFEASIAKSQLEIGVQKKLNDLETIVSDYQKQGRADAILERSAHQLQEIEEKVASQHYESYDLYSKLEELIQTLEAQQKYATNRQHADELIQRAIKLQQVVSNKTNDPPERTKRRKKTSLSTLPPVLPLPSLFEKALEVFESPQKTEGPSPTAEPNPHPIANLYPTPAPSPTSVRTLMQVFENSGWDVTDNCMRLIRVIDASLSDVLVRGSDTYYKLLDDIEAKLNNGSLDELGAGNV